MKPYEEKLQLYLKAGFNKKKILSKLQEQFGEEEVKEAEKLIDDHLNKKQTPKIIIPLIIIFLVFAIFILVVSWYAFLSNTSFESTKCPLAKSIQITGEPNNREKIVEYLTVIQDNNCTYLEFVSENISKIEAIMSTRLVAAGSMLTRTAGTYNGTNSWSIVVSNQSPITQSGYLVHEACHGYQINNNKPISEPDCEVTELNYLYNINAPQEELNIVLNRAIQNPLYAYTEKNIDVVNEWINRSN